MGSTACGSGACSRHVSLQLELLLPCSPVPPLCVGLQGPAHSLGCPVIW